jgi:hypothetical protein
MPGRAVINRHQPVCLSITVDFRVRTSVDPEQVIIHVEPREPNKFKAGQNYRQLPRDVFLLEGIQLRFYRLPEGLNFPDNELDILERLETGYSIVFLETMSAKRQALFVSIRTYPLAVVDMVAAMQDEQLLELPEALGQKREQVVVSFLPTTADIEYAKGGVNMGQEWEDPGSTPGPLYLVVAFD